MAQLIHELIGDAARRTPAALALRSGASSLDYAALARALAAAARALLDLGLQRLDRVAVFMEKREEAVLAMFGATAAGGVFVPINPMLKPEQVAHILRDSGARVLVTTPARLAALAPALDRCPALHHVLCCGPQVPRLPGLNVQCWQHANHANHADHVDQGASLPAIACVESDVAALLYTACADGAPRGVVLSHRNLVASAGAQRALLGRTRTDRVLSLLPWCDDDGLAQLTSAFRAGAASVLMTPLLVRDIPEMAERERVTEVAASASLWIQLAELDWGRCARVRQLASGGMLPAA
ncbi:MAG: AMP-binding protein, partial [Gammaproteobacteria bacterium]